MPSSITYWCPAQGGDALGLEGLVHDYSIASGNDATASMALGTEICAA